MFYKMIQNHFSLKNGLSFACASLTLLLIYNELVTLMVTKPTTTSKGEKELETSDLPEVVICLVPGFDHVAVEKYGYKISGYYEGENSESKFVGWNGRGTENKSSQEILEESLTFGSKFINDKGALVRSLYYKEEHVEKVPAKKVKARTLAYPYGRCMSISPPPQRNTSHSNLNSLYLKLHDNPLFRNKTLRVFFMDQANSLQLYPNEMEMVGDPIDIELGGQPAWKTSYKTQISRNQHVEGDPRFKCTVYTEENSYNDCVQSELLASFAEELGCQPPLLVKDQNRICNKKFNVTDRKKSERISRLFKHVYYHDARFKCKSPCTTNVFNTKFVHKAPSPEKNKLIITFDNTIEIFQSTFSIDEQTFLTRLGGSVSSGRTLLWLFLTLLGGFQVGVDLVRFTNTQTTPD